MRRKLLILHDSPDFGGHERMLLALLPAVLEGKSFDDVTFVVAGVNRRLREELARFEPGLRVATWAFTKRRGEPYLRHFRFGYRAALRRIITAERPSTILLVQGRVENLASAMTALPRDVRVVSYLPMAHRMRDMGRRDPVGDAVRRPLYRRPDVFVVPAAAVADQIAAAGGTAPVSVAHNVVSPPPRTPREEARAALGIDPAEKTALILGRLDRGQKGTDTLLGAIGRAGPAGLGGWTFRFVGDGPARADVERAARADTPAFRLEPWTDRPDLFLSAADVLLLPSRWEGLPLVMLEAMTYGVPVLASPIDVHRTYLPAGNLMDWERDDLARALDRVMAAPALLAYAAHARSALEGHTLTAARRAFANAVTGAGA